ncbi:MAG: hypothetical protein IK052_03950 [Bacteroidales bacterium]|nr:hypothetical protein [Bacteroidales bacterium]
MSKLMDAKILLLTVLSLVTACGKELDTPSPATVIETVPYRAVLRTEVGTRATLGDGMVYKFEVGDRVYVESEEGKVYGFLSMSSDSDAGNHEAIFEGNLSYVGGYRPDIDPEISLVLVSVRDDLHSVTGGKVSAVTGSSYTQDEWAPSLEEAVSRLSHFTGSGHLRDDSFTLAQQSSFLKCFVKMRSADAPVDREMTAKLVNNSILLREASITVTEAGSIPFVFAFLGGDVSLENAKLVIEWKDSGDTDQSQNFDVSNQTLAANNYYTISRSALAFDGFRITATVNGTEITFNYSGIQYSLDSGDTWTTYTSPFTLNAGDDACIKGNRTNYKNEKSGDQWGTPADKPIFRSSRLCYISGNIMSLLADDSALSESAFQGAFSRGSGTAVTYIDIHPDAPLILPVTDLANKCYMQMFRNCTSLTRAPQFRVEGTAYRCCYNMFRQCTNLTDISGIQLPAMTLSVDCYRELLRDCTKLAGAAPMLPAPTLVQECYRQMLSNTKITSIVCLATNISATSCTENWMSGVSNVNTSTFYKAPSMTSWTRNDSGIPSKWKVVDYTGE